MGDLLDDFSNGEELAGWLAYQEQDDEVRQARLIAAIVRAFNGPDKTGGGKKPSNRPGYDEDGEPIIDTTDPQFAGQFQGFIGGPSRRAPQRPEQPIRGTGDILFG